MVLKSIEIKPDIHWVGGIDWNLRNFHGYTTQRGTTYNSYLILDKKITLVDTVKHYLFNEMLSRISNVIDPKKIEYIISNHVEMDHSGSIQKILEFAPNATVITSTRGEKGLRRHYKKDWKFQVVQSGDVLNIGNRTLNFVHIPMVHWPDSMVTYCNQEKLLLSNDAFGQHIASAHRFDDEIGWDILQEEAAKYYANIVLPYGDQVKKALSDLAELEIEMIAPSHGAIWRSYINNIIQEYEKWSSSKTNDRALIVFDSMWGTTEQLAYTLYESLDEAGVPVFLRDLKSSHISDIIKDVLTSKLILLGSPTLNNGMLPSMGEFLTYLKGLRPRNRIGFVFGSYGWGGQAVKHIESVLQELSWEIPLESINIQYIPDENELQNVKETGKKLVKYLNNRKIVA